MNMNSFNSQNQKKYNSSLKQSKKRLTQDQVRLLEASFSSNKKLEPERKIQLSRELGIPPRRIAIWYQNKRVRWKNESLELDYNTVLMRLEAATAQKRQLEREVGRLQAELQKALQQEVETQIVGSMCYTNEGGGSSSLNDQSCWLNNNVNYEEVLQVEQLYAYMMGSNSGSN